MNKIVNNFLLAGDKFMPEMHLKQAAALGKTGFSYSACDPFTKTKKEFKNLKKQEAHNLFTEMNLIKLIFSMIWLMEILKI